MHFEMPLSLDEDTRRYQACIQNIQDSIFPMEAVIRFWKGFCVIWDSAEIERVIREYRKNSAVISEFYISCDARFSLSVVRDS